MDAKQFAKLLEDLNACDDAVAWAKGKTLERAWKSCVKADWLCWLLVKQADKPGWPNKSVVRHVMCDCAETALPIWHKKHPDDMRPDKAIETARRYADGKATDEELTAAGAAAADAAAAGAAYAADAAAAGAAYDAAADYAAYAAADAADAGAAYDAAADYAAALKRMAVIIRKRIPFLPIPAKRK